MVNPIKGEAANQPTDRPHWDDHGHVNILDILRRRYYYMALNSMIICLPVTMCVMIFVQAYALNHIIMIIYSTMPHPLNKAYYRSLKLMTLISHRLNLSSQSQAPGRVLQSISTFRYHTVYAYHLIHWAARLTDVVRGSYGLLRSMIGLIV